MKKSPVALACALVLLGNAHTLAEPYTLNTIAGKAGLESVEGTNRFALLSYPCAVASGPGGDLYIADIWSQRVSRLHRSGTNWVLTTLAGGTPGFADGTNGAAQFYTLSGIAVDQQTNIYVTDRNAIRKISPAGTNWVVTTWAGTVLMSGRNDGIIGSFNSPIGLAVDPGGVVYVADTGNHAIRRISPSGTYGTVSTIAGTAGYVIPASGSADGTGTSARFNGPCGIAIDSATNLYIMDTGNHTLRKVTRSGSSWVVTTLAGSALNSGSADGTNSAARFNSPLGIAVRSGAFFVTDSENHTLREVRSQGADWVVRTIAGGPLTRGASDGTNSAAGFNYPFGIAWDSSGNLYVADRDNSSIREVVPEGTNFVVSTIVGDSTARQSDGPGALARFWQPYGIALEHTTKLFVADKNNHVIRELTHSATGWTAATIAGRAGITGSTDGTNGDIRFAFPNGIARAPDGTLYVGDTDNRTIRQLTPGASGTGWVSATIAGTPGAPGFNDGTNAAARFFGPSALALNSAGELFVVDSTRIRQVTRIETNWVVTTLSGSYSSPRAITVDAQDNLYFTDSYANAILKASRAGDSWSITTIAGPTGLLDGTNSTSRFKQPSGLAVDSNGVVYVLDRMNNCVRKVSPDGTNWLVTTIAGFPPEKGSADGNGNAARLNWPFGLAIGENGVLYIADTYNDMIRMAWPSPALAIQHTAAHDILSWPQTPGRYTLQTASSILPETPWLPVDLSPSTNAGTVSLTNPVQSTRSFYRLKLD